MLKMPHDKQTIEKLLSQRYRLMQIDVSKNGLTPQIIGKLQEDLTRIFSSNALAHFIADNIKTLILLPPAQSKKQIKEMNRLYEDSISFHCPERLNA